MRFNKHAHMYDKEQMKRIEERLRDLNHFFGYSVEPKNETGFISYDYSLPENQEARAKFKEFERWNKKQMDYIRTKAHDRA